MTPWNGSGSPGEYYAYAIASFVERPVGRNWPELDEGLSARQPPSTRPLSRARRVWPTTCSSTAIAGKCHPGGRNLFRQVVADSLECRRMTSKRAPHRPRPGEYSIAGEIEDCVTDWIASLKAGDADAAQKLWQRYFETLVRLARDRLRGAARTVADEDDAALSAFDSFVRGAARGRYPPAR